MLRCMREERIIVKKADQHKVKGSVLRCTFKDTTQMTLKLTDKMANKSRLNLNLDGFYY